MQLAGELPEISPAPGMLEVVRQFVNTLDIESGTDELDSPGALLGWLDKSGLGGLGGDAHAGGPVTEADLALAISLREALRGVLSWHVTAGNEPGASASPDRAGGRDGPAAAAAELRKAAAPLRIRFEISGEGQVAAAPDGSGVTPDLARLLLIAGEAATTGTWGRLRSAVQRTASRPSPTAPPTRTGCWCSMRVCGSRAKSRAYRRRAGGRAQAQ